MNNQNLALSISGEKEMTKISTEHFKKLARQSRLTEQCVLQVINETIERTVTAWRVLAEKELLNDDIVFHIQKIVKNLAQ